MIDALTEFRIRSLEILVTKLYSLLIEERENQNPSDPDYVTRRAQEIIKGLDEIIEKQVL